MANENTMTEDIEYATDPADIGNVAMRSLTEMNIPPLPPYYEVWFSHLQNSNSGVTNEIENKLGTQQCVDEDFLRDIHFKYFNANDSSENLRYIASNMFQQTEKLQHLVGNMGSSAEEFTQDLVLASDHLGNSADPNSNQHELLGTLMVAARNAVERNRELETDLSLASVKISALQKSVKKISSDADTDFLTNLKNRRYFDRFLSALANNARASNEKLCLIVADIDHFKKFNDTWGHQVGDQVLRLVADVLRENVKGQDLLARFGGEEFALALPNTGLAGATKLADSIRMAVSKRKLVNKGTREDMGRLTMSFGVAEFQGALSIDDFFVNADAALYQAKGSGRNCVVAHQA